MNNIVYISTLLWGKILIISHQRWKRSIFEGQVFIVWWGSRGDSRLDPDDYFWSVFWPSASFCRWSGTRRTCKRARSYDEGDTSRPSSDQRTGNILSTGNSLHLWRKTWPHGSCLGIAVRSFPLKNDPVQVETLKIRTVEVISRWGSNAFTMRK